MNVFVLYTSQQNDAIFVPVERGSGVKGNGTQCLPSLSVSNSKNKKVHCMWTFDS